MGRLQDVLRLLNSFIFEIQTIQYDVQVMDFYFLQLLKLKFPIVHEYLYKHKKYFFTLDHDRLVLRTFKEKNWDSNFKANTLLFKNDNNEDTPEEKKILFEEFINNSILLKDLLEQDKEQIILLVKKLIEIKVSKMSLRLVSYKSFGYERNFEKYFCYSLLSTDISSKEFEEARRKSWEEYQLVVDKWISENRLDHITTLLDNIKDFNTRREWENQLFLLCKIGRFRLSNKVSKIIDYTQIIDVINYPVINKTEVKLFENKNEHIEFIRKIFVDAKYPFIFEGSLLGRVFHTYVDFPLSSAEIEKILLIYFKNYCQKTPKVTSELYDVWRNVISKDVNQNQIRESSEEADKLLSAHIKKYTVSCQLGSYIKQIKPDSEYYTLELGIVFSDYNDFKSWIDSAENLNDSKLCKDEMLDFLQKFFMETSKSVRYIFQNLKPVRYNKI